MDGPWLGSVGAKPEENIQHINSQPFSFQYIHSSITSLPAPLSPQIQLQLETCNFPSKTTLHLHRANYSFCSVLNTVKGSKHSPEKYTRLFQITAMPQVLGLLVLHPRKFSVLCHFQTHQIQGVEKNV